MQNKHITVLLKESVETLINNENGIYVDGTLGGGGHFDLIIEKVEQGTVIAFDIDKEAIEAYIESHEYTFEQNNEIYTSKAGQTEIYLINDSFDQLPNYLEKLGLHKIQGTLLDLGWSSNQLEGIEGLSFAKETDTLDMRMGSTLGVKASDLLNGLGKQELKKLFAYADIYGRQANILTELITKVRSSKAIEQVGELNEIVRNYIEESGIREQLESMLARVYLALRIAVNDEFGNLKRFLSIANSAIAVQGRLCIITFHSGEEKIIEEFMESKGSGFNLITFNQKKYIQPSVQELRQNLSARSAKLWVFEKK